MKTYPCAKINLGLYVTERRPDGYHNLETVFYPIPLCDELEMETATKDLFLAEGFEVAGPAEENLVLRAVRLLRDQGHPVPPLRIRLKKTIPSGAGLGGGSSDAAFTVRMANDLCALGLSDEEMEHLMTRLGADCPFFVRHQPVLATGIGDQFTPLSLRLCDLWLLLVKPDDFISTREAYANVTPRRPQYPLAESILRPVSEWSEFVSNDFEHSVFPLHPTVAAIKQDLYAHGALYAAMSGSGSSVFGLFRERPTEAVLHAFAPHFIFCTRL
ncbi:MAG: 4-(cytidine 5'-diphospho)-2-C-methyl-D-erythritol kinase [Bacteroidaceae bacterium]|nr:4-(cytidine 5'-diphospho)-2-C-methyl-D-erythritol kinase [Bacteroidaceae bacterium]